MTETKKPSQNKQFSIVFFMELWERFGYYGLMAVLVLFMMKELKIPESEAMATFGAFSALTYAFVWMGGWLGDKVLGVKRTIILGMLVLFVGYALLVIYPGSKNSVLFSLTFVSVGSAIFKANPSSLIAKMFADTPEKIDSAFTMFYMSINVGSMLSMILIPIVSAKYSATAGFAICAFGMLLAILNFVFFQTMFKGVDSEIGLQPLRKDWLGYVVIGLAAMVGVIYWLLQNLIIAKTLMIVVAMLLLLYLLSQVFILKGAARKKMIAVIILFIQAWIYFNIYQQMPMSLNVFADKFVVPNIFGIPLASNEIFQALNPIVIMLFSPILAWIYSKLGKNDLSMPAKFATGMGLCSAAFLILPFGVNEAVSHFQNTGLLNQMMDTVNPEALRVVGSNWMVLNYFFASVGELLISGLGLAMVAKLVPEKMVGLIMGCWFITTALSGITGAQLAEMTAPPVGVVLNVGQALAQYHSVFNMIGMWALGVTAVMALTVPVMKRLTQAKD